MNRKLLGAGILLSLCACGVYSANESDTAVGSTDYGDTNRDTSDTDTGAAGFARVRLSGGLEVVDGKVDGGTVVYTLYQASDTDVSCTQEHVISTAVGLESTEPDWVIQWSELTLAAAEPACGVSLPMEMRLGLGALYPEIVPLLDKYGVGDARESLQGFYAAFPQPFGEGLDGEVLAMGYGGTSAALAGEGEALTEGPFPDGLYLIESVYFLQLP
ncbi:MAG: hypothetical protein ACI9VR_003982 [Cognaticolwellia sp.]|jgi:hypothetical protein